MSAAIEQARARGLTIEQTAVELGIHPAKVRMVWDRMDELAVEADVAQALAVREQLDIGPSGRFLEPCGTHAAFVRHKQRGQEPDAKCRVGERLYQAARHQRRQAERIPA